MKEAIDNLGEMLGCIVIVGMPMFLLVAICFPEMLSKKDDHKDKEPESLPPRYQGKYNNDPLLDATAAVGRQDMGYIIKSYWHWQNYTDPTTRGMISDRVDRFLVSKGIQVVEDESLGEDTSHLQSDKT